MDVHPKSYECSLSMNETNQNMLTATRRFEMNMPETL